VTGPDESESWIDPILDAVISDVQATGYFDRVNGHEPKRAPRNGLTAAVWVQRIGPFVARSGVNVTSAVLTFMVRLYTSMMQEPQDMIDPKMLRAVANIIRRYHDNFDFGLNDIGVSNVDLLGAAGAPLGAEAGYLEIDNRMFRVFDIQVPVIVNDVWLQTA
jgi:hypothetical protein